MQSDLERGTRLGAFEGTEPEPGAVGGAEQEFAAMSVAELCKHIQSAKPSVKVLMEEIGEDPVLAQRVMEAEDAATGGKPRKNLVKAISDRFDEDEEEEDDDLEDDEDEEEDDEE
jgi:hypothetical protein